MTMSTSAPLEATSTVNDLVARHPHSLPVLAELGIDTCCGGAKSLNDAAAAAGISTELLIVRATTDGECCNCGNNCSGDG